MKTIFALILILVNIPSWAIEQCTLEHLEENRYVLNHPAEEFPRIIRIENNDKMKFQQDGLLNITKKMYIPEPTPMFLCEYPQIIHEGQYSLNLDSRGILEYKEEFVCARHYLKWLAKPKTHFIECTLSLDTKL